MEVKPGGFFLNRIAPIHQFVIYFSKLSFFRSRLFVRDQSALRRSRDTEYLAKPILSRRRLREVHSVAHMEKIRQATATG
jgi:hypothetical protein